MKFARFIQAFLREEDGAAAIEYGLIAALIAVAIIVGATLLGTSLRPLHAPGQLHGHTDSRDLRTRRLKPQRR